MKKNILFISIIILMSIFPRIWELNNFPPIIVDEAANIRDMYKLLSFGTFRPFDYEWGFGQAILIHYPSIMLVKLGFEDLMAVRLTSIILSLLALIPFFFIVKKYTNSLIAFCSTLIFSFSYYYLQFSRVGWTNIHPIFLGLYLLWIIDLAIEKKSAILFAISGIFAGLTMYTYRSGEIYIFVAFTLLIADFLKNKNIKYEFKNFSLFLFSFLVISLPWINKILSNWELYNLRARVVSIFNTEFPYHGIYNLNDVILYQIITSVKAWIFLLPVNGGGIENPRYLPIDHGVVSPIILAFFIPGLVLALINFKKTFVWIIIFFTGLIFGQILTINPPNGSRGLILLPVIYIISSLGLFYLYKKLEKYSFTKPAFLIAAFIVALFDFYFYTSWMSWIKV